MWYKNVCSASFSFVTIHACDRQTDRQTDRRTDRRNYDSQDRPRICSRGKKIVTLKKDYYWQNAEWNGGEAPSNPIVTKFGLCVPFPDVISCVKFHPFCTSSFWVARPLKLCIPVDLRGDLHMYESQSSTELYCDTLLYMEHARSSTQQQMERKGY